MKCPKCGFVSFNYLDTCKRCGRDLSEHKKKLGISEDPISQKNRPPHAAAPSPEEAPPIPMAPKVSARLRPAPLVDQAISASAKARRRIADAIEDRKKRIATPTGDARALTTEKAGEIRRRIEEEALKKAQEYRVQIEREARGRAEEIQRKSEEEAERRAGEFLEKSEKKARETANEIQRRTEEEAREKVESLARKAREEAERLRRKFREEAGNLAREAREEAERLKKEAEKFAEETLEKARAEANSMKAPSGYFGDLPQARRESSEVDEGKESEAPPSIPFWVKAAKDRDRGATSIKDLPSADDYLEVLAKRSAEHPTEEMEAPATGEEIEIIETEVEDAPPVDIRTLPRGTPSLRGIAACADLFILLIILGLFLLIGKGAFSITGRSPGWVPFLRLAGPIYLLFFLITTGYFTLFVGSVGQTPAMMVFRLKVVDKRGGRFGYNMAFFRHSLALLSLLFLGVGFWGIPTDVDKRGWHDKLTRCVVVRV